MQISSNTAYRDSSTNSLGIKNIYTQKLTKDETKELKEQITQNSNAYTFNSINVQSSTLSIEDKFEKDYQEFQSFLKEIGYDGKNIAELSQKDAGKLVSEDGFFGVDKTSQRIVDFVLSGANGDEEMLRAGREGIIQGFKDAEKAWGGELPDISQTTMSKSIEMLDMAIKDLGYSILNQEV